MTRHKKKLWETDVDGDWHVEKGPYVGFVIKDGDQFTAGVRLVTPGTHPETGEPADQITRVKNKKYFKDRSVKSAERGKKFVRRAMIVLNRKVKDERAQGRSRR